MQAQFSTRTAAQAEANRRNKQQRNSGVSLASLSRGIKAKWVKIRKVKNGIRVTIKK